MGLSQAGLAERIDTSTTFIGNIEIKKRFPSPKNLDRIAAALGVRPADLFSEEEAPEKLNQLAARQRHKARIEKAVLKAIDKTF